MASKRLGVAPDDRLGKGKRRHKELAVKGGIQAGVPKQQTVTVKEPRTTGR